MHIEGERGDLLIDILKNLLQQGLYVRENMPDEKEEGEQGSESKNEGVKERKEEIMKER